MLRAACIVSLITWAAKVQGYPPMYVASASRCWVPAGATGYGGMWTETADASTGSTLTITRGSTGEEITSAATTYVPGESYTVSFSDNTIGMFGSTAGTWTGVTGAECTASGVSQTGRYGSSTSVLTSATWTAPASGNVTLGMSWSTGPGAVMQCVEIELTPSDDEAGDEVTFTGYMSDTVCIGIINGVDFTNITTNAPAHTIQCMLLQYCIDSGYTIMEEVHPAGGSWSTLYKAKYQLDPHGAELALAELRRVAAEYGDAPISNVEFTVTGVPGAPAVYPNGSATGVSMYNGQPLGVVLATTNVTAGIPGQPVTNPTSTQGATTVASDPRPLTAAAEPDELDAGGIACVVVIAVIAAAIIVAAELKAPKNEPMAMAISSIGAAPHNEHSGGPDAIVTGMELDRDYEETNVAA